MDGMPFYYCVNCAVDVELLELEVGSTWVDMETRSNVCDATLLPGRGHQPRPWNTVELAHLAALESLARSAEALVKQGKIRTT